MKATKLASAVVGSMHKAIRRQDGASVVPVVHTDVKPRGTELLEFFEGPGNATARFVAPAAFHALCFEPTFDLLSSPDFPLPTIGLVATEYSWALHEPLTEGTSVDVTASLAASRRTHSGVEILVRVIVARAGIVVYSEDCVYLAKGSQQSFKLQGEWTFNSLAFREQYGTNKGRLAVGMRPEIASRTFTVSDSRDWARYTGDMNPIHISVVSARIFGYRSPILHGAVVDAWAMYVLGIDGSRVCSGTSYFRAPVILPRELELVSMGNSDVAVLDAASGRDLVHLHYAGAGAKRVAQAGNPRAIVLPRNSAKQSSTIVSRGMVAAAESGVVDSATNPRSWRRDYREPMARLTECETTASARRGLDFIHDTMTFADGRSLYSASIGEPGKQEKVVGVGKKRGFSLPYNGRTYRGEELRELLRDWVYSGRIQPAAFDALCDVIDTPEILDLDGWTFACLGAGAELSPAPVLLSWGATVAAVVREGSPNAERLARLVPSSAGTFLIPGRGLDVVENPEEVASWIAGLPGRIAIVDTLYAPGKEFLLAAIGADLVEHLVCAARPDTALAWYGSPTDAYVFSRPEDSCSGSARGAIKWARGLADSESGVVTSALAGYARIKNLKPAVERGVYQGLVDVQGPNYAAAKRIGRWRAMLEREAGRTVSYNVGPLATTRSVMNSRILKAAYGGLRALGMPPLEPDSASVLLAALLVWDLKQAPESGIAPQNLHGGSHPGTGDHETAKRSVDINPASDFLVAKALDCGLFSSPYEPNGLMGFAVKLGVRKLLRS